jgi:hypothetical protein
MHSGENQKYAVALGNQAAALEALGKSKEAEDSYTQSATLLKECGDRDNASAAYKKLSSLHLSHFHITQSLISYRSALNLSEKHSLWDKIFLSLVKKVPGTRVE